jgi:hypothetical protein
VALIIIILVTLFLLRRKRHQSGPRDISGYFENPNTSDNPTMQEQPSPQQLGNVSPYPLPDLSSSDATIGQRTSEKRERVTRPAEARFTTTSLHDPMPSSQPSGQTSESASHASLTMDKSASDVTSPGSSRGRSTGRSTNTEADLEGLSPPQLLAVMGAAERLLRRFGGDGSSTLPPPAYEA